MQWFKQSVLIVSLMGFSPSAWAGPRDMPKHMHKMAEELNLTAEQRTAIQKIHKDSRDKIKAQRQTQEQTRKELQDAMGKSSSTSEQLTALHERLAQNKLEMMRLHFSNMLQIRSLLTADQLTKFSKISPMDKGRGKGEHHPPFEDEE